MSLSTQIHVCLQEDHYKVFTDLWSVKNIKENFNLLIMVERVEIYIVSVIW